MDILILFLHIALRRKTIQISINLCREWKTKWISFHKSILKITIGWVPSSSQNLIKINQVTTIRWRPHKFEIDILDKERDLFQLMQGIRIRALEVVSFKLRRKVCRGENYNWLKHHLVDKVFNLINQFKMFLQLLLKKNHQCIISCKQTFKAFRVKSKKWKWKFKTSKFTKIKHSLFDWETLFLRTKAHFLLQTLHQAPVH